MELERTHLRMSFNCIVRTGFLSSSFSLMVASSASNRFLFADTSLLLAAVVGCCRGGGGADEVAASSGTAGIGVDSVEEPLDNLLPDVGVSGTVE